MIVVIDTNVPMAASGLVSHASRECAAACARRILEVTEKGKLALDLHWFIIREYKKNLFVEGEPNEGYRFLEWVLTNWTNPERCVLIDIEPADSSDRDCTDFGKFPNDPALADFDRSDRKFVAVALAHPAHPPILNATDTDWWEVREALYKHGLKIEFLCEEEMRRD
jgi:hypothetical protein